jgi:inorganic pyrophosphatase
MNNIKKYSVYIIHEINNGRKIVLVHKETDITALLESKKISYSSIEDITDYCFTQEVLGYGDDDVDVYIMKYLNVLYRLSYNKFENIN